MYIEDQLKPIDTSDMNLLERRALVSRLYLKRYTQEQIAEAMGVSQATISRDIDAVRELWKQAAVWSFNEFVAETLAELNELQREYLRSFGLSKRGKAITETLTVVGEEGALEEIQQPTGEYEEAPGSIKWLNGARKIVDRKIELVMGGKRLKVALFDGIGVERTEDGKERRAQVQYYLPAKGGAAEAEDETVIDLPAKNGRGQ